MAAPLGAIIDDLDVRGLSTEAWRELDRLLCTHHMLVFPGQSLTAQDQVDFAARWGDLVPFPYGGLPEYPNIIELRNRGKEKDVNQHWHSDMTYSNKPPKLTILYAHQAPQLGGETAFANQALAYQGLSPGIKKVLNGLQAHHSAQGLARLYGEDEEQAPRALHPVVRTHDQSAGKALYVCKAFTTHFQDWSRAESKSLLNFLFEHSVSPEFQARHQWQAGDLMVWDNRSLLHYAVHDHGDEPRLLHRCQVEGDTPG